MKRRDFLIASIAVAGSRPTSAFSQSAPCAPSPLSAVGGSTALSDCVAGEVPQWFLDMPERTWSTPVVNTLDSVKPSPLPAGNDGHRAVCNNWVGGTVDQDHGEFVLAANGGHLGYSGNEVYVCAIRSATPAWRRITDPSPPAAVAGGTFGRNSPCQYADGRPSATHTYNRPCWGNGKVWLAGIDAEYSGGGSFSTACYSFDRATLRWTYHGIGIPDPHLSNSYWKWQGGSAAFDPVTNTVWSIAQYGIGSPGDAVFTVNTLTGQVISRQMKHNIGYSWAVVAPDLRLLIVGGLGNVFTLNLDNPATGFIQRMHSGTHAPGSRHGAVYHAAARAIYSWHSNGASVIKLSIPNPVDGTWAYSNVSPSSGNAVVPTAGDANGTFGRFNIVQDMGNGQAALVLVNRTTEPTFVYKVPRGGL